MSHHNCMFAVIGMVHTVPVSPCMLTPPTSHCKFIYWLCHIKIISSISARTICTVSKLFLVLGGFLFRFVSVCVFVSYSWTHGPWTSSFSINWEIVGNAKSWALSQAYQFARFQGIPMQGANLREELSWRHAQMLSREKYSLSIYCTSWLMC